MISIEVKRIQQFQKNYLKNFHSYDFDSLFHFIFELFKNHQHGQKEIFEIEALLEETGYSNLKEIPNEEIEIIKKFIQSRLQEWKRQEDPEYLTYKLMTAIHANSITVMVDNNVIQDFESPISITPNSIITFINHSKLDLISFTTL